MNDEDRPQEPARRRESVLPFALAIATFLVLLFSLRVDKVPESLAWLLFVPVILGAYGVALALPAGVPTYLTFLIDRLRGVRPVWSVAIAALTLSFTVAQFANNAGPKDNYWPAFFLWLAAVLATVGCAVAPYAVRLGDRALVQQWFADHRWDVAAAFGLTVAALVPRIVNLSGEPTPFSGDEAAMGFQAIRVIKGEIHNMFESGLLGHSTLFFFELAGLFKVLGVSIMSERLWAVIIGTAAIPMLYLLLRSWFGRTVAILGAGYLVAYHTDLHFSRVALNNIGDPLLLTTCVYLGWRASRTLKPEDFALAGVVLGLSLYFYLGARIIPLIVVAILAFAALSRPRTIPQMLKGGVMLVAGYGIAALPLGVFWLTHQNDFMNRLHITGIFYNGWYDAQLAAGRSGFEVMWEQVRRSFGAFGYYSDVSAHYLAPIPSVDWLSLLPFLVGIGVSVVRIRDVRYFALIIMFVGSVASGGVLTDQPPTSPRMLGTIPSVASWVGLGLAALGSAIALKQPRPALVIASLGLAALMAYNLHFYFFTYRTGDYYSDYNTRVATQVAEYVKTLPEDTRVFWYGDPQMFMSGTGHPAMTFPLRDRPRFDVLESGKVVPSPALGPVVGDAPAVFLFMPHRQAEMEPLIESCPGGETKTFVSKAGRKGLNDIQRTDQTSFTAYEVLTPNHCLPLGASMSTGG